jgi:hypothetical protein
LELALALNHLRVRHFLYVGHIQRLDLHFCELGKCEEIMELEMKRETKSRSRQSTEANYRNMDCAKVLHIIHQASSDAGSIASRRAAGTIADRGFPRAR